MNLKRLKKNQLLEQHFKDVLIAEGYLDLNRKISKSYLFKKKVKLALYKLFVYVPRLIFGENFKEDTNEVDNK